MPHSLDKGEPRILNLDNVDTFLCINGLSEPMYAFFEQPSTESMLTRGTYFGGSFEGQPIRNVFVTTWNAPSAEGGIRSCVATLLANASFTSTYRKSAQRAEIRRVKTWQPAATMLCPVVELWHTSRLKMLQNKTRMKSPKLNMFA